MLRENEKRNDNVRRCSSAESLKEEQEGNTLIESLQRQLQVAQMRLDTQPTCDAYTQHFEESRRKTAEQVKRTKLLRWKTEQLDAMHNQLELTHLRDSAIPLVRSKILRTEKLIAEASADPMLLQCPVSADKRRRLKRDVEKLQKLNERYHQQTVLLERLQTKNVLAEAMRTAANMNDIETIKQLLTQGVSVNTVDECGFSAFSYACRKGHEEAVSAMIDHADLEDSCNNNNLEGTPLILSTKNKHLNVVVLLLKYGVDIEARDRFGKTALHWACANGSRNAVKLLLENGAKVDVVDNQGSTCLRLAGVHNDATLEKLLLDSGVN
jgi:ankyrin repeat protein